jgi:hypothetical protein
VSARAFDIDARPNGVQSLERLVARGLAAGARDVRGAFLPCTWEPVGTLSEYLA